MGVVAFPGQNEAEGNPRAWVLPYSLYAVDPGVGKVSARLWGQERLRDGLLLIDYLQLEQNGGIEDSPVRSSVYMGATTG